MGKIQNTVKTTVEYSTAVVEYSTHLAFNSNLPNIIVINAHSPLRAIQNGGRGNYKEAEGFVFENR